MRALYSLYRQELSQAVLAIWWAALQGYDLATVADALNRHAVNPDNGRFLPTPADVVRLIGGTTHDSALLAWAKVDKAVRTIGSYRSVVFDDAIVHAVLADMGGWVALCSKRETDWPFVAKEFENRYRGYVIRSELSVIPNKLIGRIDADREQHGLPHVEPALIGDECKARAVLEAAPTANRITQAAQTVAQIKARHSLGGSNVRIADVVVERDGGRGRGADDRCTDPVDEISRRSRAQRVLARGNGDPEGRAD